MVVGKRKREDDYVGWVPAVAIPAAGPSSNPTMLDTPPKTTTKKPRKKADPDSAQPEKRNAIFKRKCPKNILDRVDRVISQRFFMVDRKRIDGALREEFSVLGSTGNVYTVTIDKTPTCNCPDATKGNHCKHILFVFLKVLQVSQESGVWYQKALLTSELETIFAEAPLAPNAMAHPGVREAYERATGSVTKSKTIVDDGKKKRIPGPDDDCPICYDSMHEIAEKSLTFCEECGNAVHTECFQQWQNTAIRDSKPMTCVWCRAKWTFAGAVASGSSGAKRTAEGYINIGSAAGLSPVRDTSTYYHGPKRGKRYYGYQEYDDY